MLHTANATINGKSITLETGVLARQANGSVLLKCGDAVIMATATMAKEAREGADFFPLTVEYLEKMYSAGKIPGGFFKRETRPGTPATLNARLIDRPIRPLFPDEFFNEVQVVITILSHDETVDPEALSISAASAALTVSDVPFQGPVGAALVCEVDGELVTNPSAQDSARATMHLMVAGTKDAVLMIEAGAHEVSEERIIEGIRLAHESIREFVALQEDLQSKAGKEKVVFEAPAIDSALKSQIESIMGNQVEQNMQSGNKQEVDTFLKTLEATVVEQCVSEDGDNESEVKRLFNKVKKEHIRQTILRQKVRPDGRRLDEIRPISIHLDQLPSAHGSAVFTRGETQSLGVVTLGTSVDEKIEEGLTETVKQKYFFHYNFPPYSVGECGFVTRTGRRELGHGALAQRALEPVLPDFEAFPYTLRIVSEILESNGSSSMASVCSGSLSMMDCGVPVKSAVSGIAMGLLLDDEGFVVLSDIQGLEDHYGDMDFKVAGTNNGVTALQLDIKVSGLSEDILRQALAQAKTGRLHILDTMNDAIDGPREQLAANAPKIDFVMIDPEKVGTLIGPGGKMIRRIEEETGATVVVEDGNVGRVSISAPNQVKMDHAKNMIDMLVREFKEGDRLEAKVTKIVNFGAFVDLGGSGQEALLHISKIAKERISKVEDYLDLGQMVDVEIDEVSGNGKISVRRVLN